MALYHAWSAAGVVASRLAAAAAQKHSVASGGVFALLHQRQEFLLQGTARTASTSTSSTSTSTSSSTKASSSSTQQQQQQRALPKEEEEPLEQIRARVFGAHVGDGRRSGRRALMRPLRGKEWAGWYYFSRARQIPFLEDDLETERLERVELFKATERAPPKKGQGKRASKKK